MFSVPGDTWTSAFVPKPCHRTQRKMPHLSQLTITPATSIDLGDIGVHSNNSTQNAP